MYATPVLEAERTMGKIVNRLADIKAAKQRELGRDIPWDEVARETGLAYTTVLRWAKGQINRYDDDALARFCEYFGVKPGDILEYEE